MNVKKQWLIGIAALMILTAPSAARASSFFPTQFPWFPDLGGKGDITYNATTDIFNFAGLLESVQVSASTPSISPNCSGLCDYTLVAHINGSGILNPVGSTISIRGGVPDFGHGAIAPGSLLLSGNLVAFNFIPGDPDPDFGGPAIFEFLVNVTSSNPYLGYGPLAGVRLSPFDLAATNFLTDFGGDTGFARINSSMQLPEPGSVLLLGTGLAALWRRKRSKV